ncbi:septum formation family protein [Demequina sediminicola]|uniref:septum formation family protein n=1 Tax=Demequina sediminicola TaxID=1095026 RepID=UPI000783AE38|nr:septum formation family protein [Demequina sediminicola]
MRRRMSPIIAVAALVVALTGCGSEPETEITVEALTMTVGECVWDEAITSDTTTEIGERETVECSEPHHGEVYYTEDVAGSVIPDNLASTATDACVENFEPYVGIAHTESKYAVSLVYPSATTWEAGDRQIACLLIAGPDEELTSSAKGSAE